ncbi:unnamed protein product, partial [Brassica rapa subsp. trilocularis]
MVFYFKARPDAGDYTIFMGLDKFENEELIKYGFPEDLVVVVCKNLCSKAPHYTP